MGRTIPSLRIVLNEELARMATFKRFFKAEDRVVFDDLVTHSRIYAPVAGVLAWPVKEIRSLLSMTFANTRHS